MFNVSAGKKRICNKPRSKLTISKHSGNTDDISRQNNDKVRQMEQGGGDSWTPVSSPRIESAINDTDRVHRTRSVFTNHQQSTSAPTMDDYNQVGHALLGPITILHDN